MLPPNKPLSPIQAVCVTHLLRLICFIHVLIQPAQGKISACEAFCAAARFVITAHKPKYSYLHRFNASTNTLEKDYVANIARVFPGLHELDFEFAGTYGELFAINNPLADRNYRAQAAWAKNPNLTLQEFAKPPATFHALYSRKRLRQAGMRPARAGIRRILRKWLFTIILPCDTMKMLERGAGHTTSGPEPGEIIVSHGDVSFFARIGLAKQAHTRCG